MKRFLSGLMVGTVGIAIPAWIANFTVLHTTKQCVIVDLLILLANLAGYAEGRYRALP